MKRRFLAFLLTSALAATMAVGLVACNRDGGGDNRYTIVYLGDSIAEALIGPSPLSERDNYGYYAIVGRTNGFKYYNHAVSGHKTSTGIVSGDGLLEMINKEDQNAVLMRSHIKQADMIHVSVLGNNVLQYNIGLMLLEVADRDFETRYEAGKLAEDAEQKTLINALEEGSLNEPLYRDSVDEVDEDGKPVPVKFDFPSTYDDICNIVAKLKELNPNATLVFQKVYNPFYEGSKHLTAGAKARLAEITDDGRFGAEGEPIATMSQYRRLADYLLGKLNGILDKYLAEHEGAFKVLDAAAAFDRVAALDKNPDGSINLGGDSLGRRLIYEDWTHPSNLGHAVIAGMTQELLEELHIASPDALAGYKAIRVEQINRLFKDIDGFDATATIEAISSAEEYLDVTLAYFDAIKGYTPVVPDVSDGDLVTGSPKTSFPKTVRFKIDASKSGVMDVPPLFLSLGIAAATDNENTYLEFTPDGKMHLQVQTVAGLFGETMDGLFGLADNLLNIHLDRAMLGNMLAGFGLEGIIDSMAEPMFPGFKAELLDGDLEGALEIVRSGLGFDIEGLDYEDDGVKDILRYIAENMTVPTDLFEKIPEDTQLTLTFDSRYYVKDVKGADGKSYKAIYVGPIGANDATQPFCVFDVTENNNGAMCLYFKIEFMNVRLAFEQNV